ncbi:MAG TPA: universal stress protein [Streptosporangiaceae bacterium]|jgi:nucleotide-binding universal stress UspA family protein
MTVVSDMVMERREAFELGTDGPQAIVVGVDGSPASLRAAAYAAGLARRQRARLVCVYVRRPMCAATTLSCWWIPAAIAAETATLAQVEDDVRRRIADDSQAWGTTADIVVRTGDPFTELAAVARDVGAETIVVGAAAGLAHRLFGSLGARLQRRRRWPVTVVP